MFCLVVICDITSFVWIYPIKTKDMVTPVIKNLIEKVRVTDGWGLNDKVIKVVRSDNEPVLRSAQYKQMLKELSVVESHSVPYSPQMNGVVERFMRTMGENLRSNMRGVDGRLWEWCVKYLAWCWNRIPKRVYARAPQFNGMAPLDARNSRKRSVEGEIHKNESDKYQNSLEIAKEPDLQETPPKISNKDFLLWQTPSGSIAKLCKTTKSKNIVYDSFDTFCEKVFFNSENSRGRINSDKSMEIRRDSDGSQILDGYLEQSEYPSDLLECDSIPTAFIGKIREPLKVPGGLIRKDNSLEASPKIPLVGAMPDKIDKSYRWAHYFRPFGTLAYVFKEPREKVGNCLLYTSPSPRD